MFDEGDFERKLSDFLVVIFGAMLVFCVLLVVFSCGTSQRTASIRDDLAKQGCELLQVDRGGGAVWAVECEEGA